jgi:hypothetical protein
LRIAVILFHDQKNVSRSWRRGTAALRQVAAAAPVTKTCAPASRKDNHKGSESSGYGDSE